VVTKAAVSSYIGTVLLLNLLARQPAQRCVPCCHAVLLSWLDHVSAHVAVTPSEESWSSPYYEGLNTPE